MVSIWLAINMTRFSAVSCLDLSLLGFLQMFLRAHSQSLKNAPFDIAPSVADWRLIPAI